MPRSPERVAVLGGGVTGITTGLLLQLGGRPTIIYTQSRPRRSGPSHFASLHAAASVLPHSVRSSRMSAWLRQSQAIYRLLAFRANAGVRKQTHYELFERPTSDLPAYAAAVDDIEAIDAGSIGPGTPYRTGAAFVSGWRFDVYFCEAPTYLSYLYRFFEAIGGVVVDVGDDSGIDGELAGYVRLGHRVVVNCTGHGVTSLLDERRVAALDDRPDGDRFSPLLDPWGFRVVRGHYLRVAVRQQLVDERGRFLSYNYTPTADVYATADGVPADVYCYPRSDCWILGGSRQPRVVDEEGERWLGDDAVAALEARGSDGRVMTVPQPILTLNADLIEGLTNGELSLLGMRDTPGLLTGGIGYRFERTHPDESIRVDASRVALDGNEAVVLHNYGHGGAGFTLSWGCALDVVGVLDALDAGGWSVPSCRPRHENAEFSADASQLTDVVGRLR